MEEAGVRRLRQASKELGLSMLECYRHNDTK
jgi:hypothetical protein